MLQIGIFVAVTGAALAIMRYLTGGRTPSRLFRRRFDEEFTSHQPSGEPGLPLYKNLDEWDEAIPGERPVASASDGSAPPAGWQGRAEEALRQAGFTISVRTFLGVVGGFTVSLGVAGLACAGLLGCATGAVAGAILPFATIAIRRRARRDKYLKQLISAFELMARVIRAGRSVPESFRATVESFDAPLSEEFGRCLHQIEHGLRPEAAFRELSERAGILELRLFVVAMTIQRQTGGNLSEVLERLAGVIRSRLRLKQRIRALTAEGRLQSLALTVLPVLTFGVIYFLNRPYAELLLAQWRMLLLAVGCVVVGTLWIRSIVNFEG